MKKLVSTTICFLAFTFSNLVFSQDASGTIYLYDGGKINFSEIVFFVNHPKSQGYINNYKELGIIYNSTLRWVKFSDLKEFTIVKYKAERNRISDATAKILTKTGMEVESDYYLLEQLRVRMYDELSGRIIEQDINFADGNNALIRKIVFD